MPARRLRLVAPLLALLVALAGAASLAGGGGLVASGGEPGGPSRIEHDGVPVARDLAAVVRSTADHVRTQAAAPGPTLAWIGAAGALAAALVAGALALDPVAIPSRTTAHVRRRGPPSPV